MLKIFMDFCETSGPAGSWVRDSPHRYCKGLIDGRSSGRVPEAGVCVQGQGGRVRTRKE